VATERDTVVRMAEPLPAPAPPGAALSPLPGVVPLPVVPGAQCAALIVSLIRVTLPLRASARPWRVTPLFSEIDVRAMTLPTKADVVPKVAELPTCQNTLHGCAPLIMFTRLADAVIRVEAAWKMNTELGSPWASSVSAPVSPSAPGAL
jgi:hypothetical protein